MVKVQINCPLCNKYGKVELKKVDILKKSSSGLAAINIKENIICEHSFVAYIDKNLNIRDSFVCDFKIELPEIKQDYVKTSEANKKVDDIKVDLIVLNIKALEIVYILNGILMKKKILFIHDNDVIYNPLYNMIEFIFHDNFHYDFSILNQYEYRKDKKSYKKHEVIYMDNILKNKKKDMKKRRIKIESAIVKKFLFEEDPSYGLLLFRNEINKAFRMSNEIINILQNNNGNQKLSKKKLVDILSEKFEINIQSEYLEFLLEIVKNYHGYNLSGLSDYYFPNLGL
ncbi:MAG: hypothetical protein EU541_00430 [Promethearchaeota archaeon]|nr:MAG: hypothetical protein EU541_00430 [Candidatus Lokiarchaeota archaeon]